MYATLQEDECELGLDCRFRDFETAAEPRQFSNQEKRNSRARFDRRSAPKMRTQGGAHLRRNKSYAH